MNVITICEIVGAASGVIIAIGALDMMFNFTTKIHNYRIAGTWDGHVKEQK